jgi:hypothetical protein
VSNSSQPHRAERTAKLTHLQSKEQDHIEFIINTDKSIKQHCEEWESETWQRIDLKDDTLSITDKKDTSQYIKHKLRERHCNENYIDYITVFLKPESKRDWNLGEGFRNSKPLDQGLENLIEEYFRLNSTIRNLEHLIQLGSTDKERFRELDATLHVLLDRVHFVAKKLNITLVNHDERGEKISTELPPELETQFYFALFDLYQESDIFNENVLKIAKKVKVFPITDKKKNELRALQTRAFAECFHGLNQRILPSLKDEKYAFSEFEWYNTLVKEENFSKHGAAVKSRVEAVDKDGKPTGQYRPLTREAVGDNKEEVTKDLERALVSFDVFAWLHGLVQWHDIEGQVAQRVAMRRIKLNPKLSETAFGAN